MNYSNYILCCLLAVILSVMTVQPVFSQENKGPENPKIALVLSGGGAKGLAHIGVLKVLEEAGIRPDIITGTSMGSIVGSLYAAGYNADELTDINMYADWEQLLTDKVELRKVAMNEKSETQKYLFEIPIEDNKINLPAGLIEGQHLEAYFAELLWPLSEEQDFDELPIPFHCMSVDMVSGKTIEHSSGDLVRSIRSSMSIPTVFSPVQMDSMLLVDGGVTRNFPVQEAIDMGADIIIGVYLGFDDDVTAKDLTSMTDILQRSIALAGIVDSKNQSEKCDILIVPDLENYGAADFTKGMIIQELGEKAAREHFDELKAIAYKYNRSYEPIGKIDQPERIKITGFEVEGLEYLSKNQVLSRSGIEKGSMVSYNNIREAIQFMYGTRYFRKLTYSLKKDIDQEGYILVFHIKENPRSMLKLAPSYDNELGVGIVTNFTLRNVVAPATNLLLTFNLAENPGFEASLSKTVGKKQHLSDIFYMKNYNYKLPFYDSGQRLGNYRKGYFEGGYGLQYLLGLNQQIGGNLFYRYNRLTPRSDLQSIYQEADFDYIKSHELGYNLFFKLNTTDNLYFPKKGIKLSIMFNHALSVKDYMELNHYNSDDYFVHEVDAPYATLIIDHSWYKTFARYFTYNFGAGAGLNTDNPGTNGILHLGGSQFGENKLQFIDLAGYHFAELYAYNYIALKSALNIEIATGLYLSGTVNVVNSANTYKDLFENMIENPFHEDIWGYSIGLKYDSLMGPIKFLVSDNNMDGETRFCFSIGFPF